MECVSYTSIINIPGHCALGGARAFVYLYRKRYNAQSKWPPGRKPRETKPSLRRESASMVPMPPASCHCGWKAITGRLLTPITMVWKPGLCTDLQNSIIITLLTGVITHLKVNYPSSKSIATFDRAGRCRWELVRRDARSTRN